MMIMPRDIQAPHDLLASTERLDVSVEKHVWRDDAALTDMIETFSGCCNEAIPFHVHMCGSSRDSTTQC